MEHSTHLSIITITYQNPVFLKRTVASLRPLRSTRLKWEHIIVDSSPELNAPLISRLKRESWPLRHIEEPPAGIFPAMNLGIRSAEGSLIWLLNAGDQLKAKTVLEKIVMLLDKNPDIQLICAAADLVRRGRRLYTAYPRATFEDSLLSGRTLCHQAMIYRKAVFDEVGNYSTRFRLASDHEHHLRMLFSGKRILCLPDVVTVWDGDGVSYHRFPELCSELREVKAVTARRCLHSVDYVRYSLNMRWYCLRGRFFCWLRTFSLYTALLPLWLSWRRLTLRFF